MLRGARLKNTEWIVGIAVYTGVDTKIMLNANKSKNKQSNIELQTNNLIIGILVMQLIVSIISGIGAGIFMGNS